MAQHDMNIANQGFPATRADLNNALQAIATNNSGTSAPSTTFANQWWYDTANNKLYIRNEANNAWIQVAVLDQTNNEWQITTGVIQAKDSDGLALKTDDGTTRLFIKDSDGKIGIGTASPTANLTVSGTVFASSNLGIRTDSPAQNLHVHQDDSDASRVVFTNTTTGTSGSDGFLVGLNSSEQAVIQMQENKDMRFYTNNTERLTILAGGDVTIADGNLSFASGHGIDFSATANGAGSSSRSELLADYEEGLWTPTMNVGSVDVFRATYVKVGDLVHCSANLGNITEGSSSSAVQVTGLPFTAHSSQQGTGSVMFRQLSRTNAIQLNTLISPSTAYAQFFWSFNNGSGWSGLTFADSTSAPWDMIFSLTYRAT